MIDIYKFIFWDRKLNMTRTPIQTTINNKFHFDNNNNSNMTLMMTSAQVCETSVNITNNTPSRDYSHPDDQTTQTTETPRFKPFTVLIIVIVHCYDSINYKTNNKWFEPRKKGRLKGTKQIKTLMEIN